jgi:hypothetical protein
VQAKQANIASCAPAGKARPKDFDSKSGSQHHVHVWKRVKA